MMDLTYAIGITVGKEGEITGVAWDSPLFNEGVTTGTKIVAIDGREYSDDDLKGAITAAKETKEPIRLLVKKGELYRTVELDYHDGLRYPRLVRSEARRVGKGWVSKCRARVSTYHEKKNNTNI